MERFICIHGHFYQPPRENAWLESVEQQDSAYPYHDWNERITAECYGPNAVARILDAQGRIARLINNYSRISFNFGPTLLSWLQENVPEVYRAVLEADAQSRERFSGHGSAVAQAYNHVILPLASRRDKVTQVRWGIRDFEHRFGRAPEGMWLPETAVDLESLEVLAEHGIRFTVLAPHQVARVRKIGEAEWQDVSGSNLDSTRAYVQRLPSGRTISLFFYDGPIARAVAFEKLLASGERFADRLRAGFRGENDRPQLVHIATDGESYGHHHAHGDMAVAYALENLQADAGVRLTNYGEFLELHPPTHEVEIIENTSWSCAHGVERWRSDCGCSSGRPGWNQAWRGPLRSALDWLRDAVAPCYEQKAVGLLTDPWAARDDYIAVILDRSDDSLARFFRRHAPRDLDPKERAAALKLLEIQRQAQLMYTSCGWFFDDISGIETVQVVQYAARAVQLAREEFGHDFEPGLLERLEQARGNLPGHGDGRRVYEKFVRPAAIDWLRIGAHYAVSSLFETYEPRQRVYCYTVEREDYRVHEAGKVKLAVGRALLTSEVTRESERVCFGVAHLGDHNVSGGVSTFAGQAAYDELARELAAALGRADFAEVVRVMDRGFGGSTYSLRSLFRDDQRRIMKRVLAPALADAEGVYRRLFEQNLPTMRFLAETNALLPAAFRTAAQFLINTDLHWALGDDEPNVEQARELLHEAGRWGVDLDTAGLAYRYRKRVGRVAERCRDRPEDAAALHSFDALVGLARSLPFEVDLWRAQNVYCEICRTAFPDTVRRAAEGDEAARAWLGVLVGLGEKLRVQVTELREQMSRANEMPSVRDEVRQLFARRHTPLTTYRLQFDPKFTFADAAALASYLDALGVTDLYASPVLRARPGSAHGYDICDHGQLNPELGGEEGFGALSAALRERGMGLILDTVPNHMGIGHPANAWWMDVLENGPSSIYAGHFDIDWLPVNPALADKVLLPILGDQYGTVLESGQIRLAYEEGAFYLHYYEAKLPVAPATYKPILEHRLEWLDRTLGADSPHLQELRSILTAMSYLPPRATDLPPEKKEERNREKEVIKRRLAALAGASPEVRRAVAEAVEAFNGRAGEPRSFELLDALINAQAYRPAYWRVAGEEINYRRFFDINELAAIRVELPEVFRAAHRLIFRLLAEGKVQGLRIDHPDGLWNPAAYFRQLQENYIEDRIKAMLAEGPGSPALREAAAAQARDLLAQEPSQWPSCPLYVVAEKILGENEPLPQDWAVSGTTGYDFLNAVNGLFVDRARRDRLDDIYTAFTGMRADFGQLVLNCQRTIMLVSMASEVSALSHQLDRISERNRRYRDFTLNTLTFAVREIISALVIYRTYITSPENVSPRDRKFLEAAIAQAKTQNLRTASAIFDFVGDTVMMRNVGEFREEDRPLLTDWSMKFQQTTGPVLAKGMEDTAFYVYNRLASLNEVGGHPEHFGVNLDDFHRYIAVRLRRWPHSMATTGTHDTKRGEDTRARVNVLSELPDEWEAALRRWGEMNAAKKGGIEGRPAPTRNDEYLLYQTLLGAWPAAQALGPATADFRERVTQYMLKAIKEAKTHTSWVNPNAEYETATRQFVERLLPEADGDPFLDDFLKLQRRVAFFGYLNALAQLVLKMTSPGVTDFFQGTELWAFTLVDPDNRRPVDYGLRQKMLAELKDRSDKEGADLASLARELLVNMADGRVKLYVTYRVLACRRAHREIFLDGDYLPVSAVGDKAEHVCAFIRSRSGKEILTAVPRLVVGLTAGKEVAPLGAEVWGTTRLALPPDRGGARYRNVFTGEVLTAELAESEAGMPLADVFRSFPVAILERVV